MAGVKGSEPAEAASMAATISDEQWKAMSAVVTAIYNYREPDGYDPSRLFHKNVNKRNVPDYHDVISEPMALSVLKQKIKNRVYRSFADFVRDCALISHNAQTYNRPKSQAYEDAVVIKDVFISEFRKLAEDGVISHESSQLPDLGEIPEADPLVVEGGEGDGEVEEEDEDPEEEPEDSEEETTGVRRGRKRGQRGKRDSTGKDELSKATDPDSRKKRGRPPRVDTPMEARIKAVLKGIRKLKDNSGQLKVRHFERLPDKAAYPDYYVEIKEPIAIDIIKRKSKRKKYNSVDHFMRDVDVMFNNAKQYNEPNSHLYRDADDLHKEAHRLAEQEKLRPDNEYLMEDGRFPLPNGISFKGDIWRVGDWAHIKNPNDASKPIVAQIYRTWQDSEDQKWVNACWYYRPEQTIHNFEKHFFPNEVVKTGQYRDHRIEEMVDKCFVMFVTRYNRGRPRGLLPNREVYVCEARYNEEKHKLNKIKTWASCLPDEVREKDYEMDLFDAPRKIKKIPSPIRHLLKEEAKETDDMPKPTWGVENAPPIVGAVHRRPRDENDSPPPEPTPSPPPPQPMVIPQQSMHTPLVQPQMMHGIPQGDPRFRSPMQGHAGQGAQFSTVGEPSTMPARPHPFHQSSYQPGFQRQSPGFPAQQQSPHQVAQPNATPYGGGTYYPGGIPPGAGVQGQQHIYNPNAPRDVEVFRLPDSIQQQIPKEIRDDFQQDGQGRNLFFTAPPLDVVANGHQGLGHSVRYLAARARRQGMIDRKRKQIMDETLAKGEDTDDNSKKQKKDDADPPQQGTREAAMKVFIERMQKWTDDFYKMHYGDRSDEVQLADMDRYVARLAKAEEERNKPLKQFNPANAEPKLRWPKKGENE